MKRAVYVICIWLIGISTVLTAGSTVWALIDVAPFLASLEGEATWVSDLGYAAASLGLTFIVFQWGVVVVPLGIIALIAKPAPEPQMLIVERREPALPSADVPLELKSEDREARLIGSDRL